MLTEETKKFEVSSEKEATAIIEKYKDGQHTEGYDLSKAGYTRKPVKVKKEIIGEIFTVTITKKFNQEV